MPPSSSEILAAFDQNSYLPVPFSMDRAAMERAIGIFLEFLKLPQEVKDPIYFQRVVGERGGEVGYKQYLRSKGDTDNREYVHYHFLAEYVHRAKIEQHPEVKALFEVMREIYTTAIHTLRPLAQSIDQAYPGFYDALFPPDDIPNFYLRFLKYDRGEPGSFLAKGHYDRGVCTLALAESAPGLRIGKTDQDVKEVQHHENQALFFPGIKFPELTNPKHPAAWHDVVQKDEHHFSDNASRWAIVFFAGSNKGNYVTYENAHTPKA